ncbi:MAG: hypothetical protein BWY22_01383 [Bacteroidetes bacterium ADurb.Bin217]|nr:MAG: hypothetical protein BWY22_01383 [Bacteroidetes bacterium ADurb.Bin217]
MLEIVIKKLPHVIKLTVNIKIIQNQLSYESLRIICMAL